MMARYRLCLTCRSRLHALLLGIESVDKGHAMQRAFHRCPCCKAVLLQLCNNCDMSLLGSCTDGVQQALAQCLCKQGACPPPPPLCLAGCHCNMAMTAVEAGMPCTPWRPVSGTAGDEGGTRGACTARAGQAHVRPARCPAPSQLLMPAPDGGLRP